MVDMTGHTICITAAQRAGTTALQHALDATGSIVNYGEIFHTDPQRVPKPDLMFLNFTRANNIGFADIMIADSAKRIADQYIALLECDAHPKFALIDVKFNSWPILSPAWRYHSREPFFFECLKQHGAVFVFIWRENLAEQILSDFLFRKIGILHNLDEEHVGRQTFEAPVQQLKWLAINICRSEAYMYSYLQSYAQKIIIKYEDLFHGGILTDRFKTAFAKFVDASFPNGRLGEIRPNTVDKQRIISNYDEAATAIMKTAAEHRWVYR